MNKKLTARRRFPTTKENINKDFKPDANKVTLLDYGKPYIDIAYCADLLQCSRQNARYIALRHFDIKRLSRVNLIPLKDLISYANKRYLKLGG